MTELKSVDISPANIKIRWDEPYTSEGLNKQESVIPRGIYRGFLLDTLATPGTGFRLRIDTGDSLFEDSTLVYFDETNGHALVVRESADVTFDMSASMPTPATGVWYVWADVDYSVSSATTGEYHVTDTTPPAGAIVFGQISWIGSMSTIQASNLATTGRTVPESTKRKDGAYVSGDQIYGFLSGEESWRLPTTDQKEAMDYASSPSSTNPFVTQAQTTDKVVAEAVMLTVNLPSSATKVQLTGKFYIGNSTELHAPHSFFGAYRLYSGAPLVIMSTGEQIDLWVYKSDDSVPVQASDADSAGFYENPWVHFVNSRTAASVSVPAGDIYIHAFRRTTFSGLPVAPASSTPVSGRNERFRHTSKIKSMAHTGSPDSLSVDEDLSTHIGNLLGFINNRISTQYPASSGPTNWTVLWQSDNKANGEQSKESITIYFKKKQVAVVFGGSLAPGTTMITSGTGDDTTPVTMIWYDPTVDWTGSSGEEPALWFMSSTDVTPHVSWDYTVESNWDYYNRCGSAFGFMTNAALFLKEGATIITDEPDDLSVDFLQIARFRTSPSSTEDLSLWASKDGEFLITANAVWNQSEGGWEYAYASTKDSFAIGIGNGGITLYRMDKDDPDHDPDEYWPHSGWTTAIKWMAVPSESGGTGPGSLHTYNCAVSSGELYERIKWAWQVVNRHGSSEVLYGRDGINFRNKWNVVPSNQDITEEQSSNISTALYVDNANSEKWGGYMDILTDSLADDAFGWSTGYVEFYS